MPAEGLWNMSSTALYTQKAFAYHDLGSETSAEPSNLVGNNIVTPSRSSRPSETLLGSSTHHNEAVSTDPAQPTVAGNRISTTARALIALLPDIEATALLVDTYFDRVHWFMLVFFQNSFRRRFEELYSGQKRPNRHSSDAFLALLSTVVAIASQYVGSHRRRLLEEYGIDPDLMRREIFAVLKNNILDIVSSGSLEAAQTCVLMGSYYLYQRERGLAWTICGCALRLALTLNLHRARTNLLPWEAESNENRKRCWWSIYEIETFSCMLYGYPSSTSDDECDVTRLDPHYQVANAQSSPQPGAGITLRSYKYFMSELSTITQYTLKELYNSRPKQKGGSKLSTADLQRQIEQVAEIDSRLLEWKASLPFELRLENQVMPAYGTAEDLDKHIRASGPQFEDHIYQLQALSLKLAYENLRILVHRPLLLYQMVVPQAEATSLIDSSPLPPRHDPFQFSLEACREAALEISEIADSPVFPRASGTYAVSFVSMHLFTAGVTLSIMASLDPLSPQSHRAKTGLRKVMCMQSQLKGSSAVAAQGLVLLQRLTKLYMEKELRFMLSAPTSQETFAGRGHEESRTNRSTPSKAGATQIPPASGNPSHQIAGDPTASRMPDIIPEDQSTTPGWDFQQDPIMTEAFMNFESMMSSYSEQGLQGDGVLPMSNDNGFMETEQAWLWDLNLA